MINKIKDKLYKVKDGFNKVNTKIKELIGLREILFIIGIITIVITTFILNPYIGAYLLGAILIFGSLFNIERG